MALALYFMSKNMKKNPDFRPPPFCCESEHKGQNLLQNGLIHSLDMQELQSLSGLIRTVYCCGEPLACFAVPSACCHRLVSPHSPRRIKADGTPSL